MIQAQPQGQLPKIPPMPKLPPEAPGTDPSKFPTVPQSPSGGGGTLNYQTGFNADRQSVNQGDILGRLAKEGKYRPQQQSREAARGIADLQRAQSMNDVAHLKRGIESTNAAQNMQNQVTRSELMQSGLSNQAKIYADMAQRETDQVGLAAKLQEAIIRNRFALAQGLLEQTMVQPGYQGGTKNPMDWP